MRIETGASSNSNLPPDIRRGFITKVLGIIATQLLITIGITAAVMACPDSDLWFKEHWWIAIVFMTVAMVPLGLLSFSKTLARNVRVNYLFLLFFTLGLSGMVAETCSFYETFSVLLVAGLTVAMTVTLAGFVLCTKCNIWYAVLIAVFFCLVLCGVGLGILFVSTYRGIALIFAGIWVFVYSLMLIYDLKMLAGGKNGVEYSEDDYILAAMNIYTDLMILFLYLLRGLGEASNNS